MNFVWFMCVVCVGVWVCVFVSWQFLHKKIIETWCSHIHKLCDVVRLPFNSQRVYRSIHEWINIMLRYSCVIGYVCECVFVCNFISLNPFTPYTPKCLLQCEDKSPLIILFISFTCWLFFFYLQIICWPIQSVLLNNAKRMIRNQEFKTVSYWIFEMLALSIERCHENGHV